MRIHIYSRSFAPSIGGMERLMEVLAGEFVRQGHAVTVVTETPGHAEVPYPVVRSPGFLHYLALARDSDVILSAPLSLRRLPAQALAGRRIVVAPPLPFPRTGKLRYVGFLKRLVSRLVSNIVPSESMAREFPRSIVIPNPFDQSAFFQTNLSAAGTVLFAGRLVEGKGCGILLEAFARAALAHPAATLTIAGDGPERQMLETMASRLGIKDRVRFLGDLRSADIAGTMREHRVMVVPSLEEAFGIVALEGLASGCRLIVAETGGLPEAVGPCALRFPRGDAGALAACIERALGPDDIPPPRAEVAAHLERFTPRLIAEQYLAVLGSGQ